MMMALRVPLLIAANGLQVRDTGKEPGLHSWGWVEGKQASDEKTTIHSLGSWLYPLGCLLAADRTPTCEDNCKTIEGWGMRDRGTQDCFPRPYPSQSTSNYCPQSAWPCRSGDCQPPAKLVVGGQTEVTENSCGRAWPEVNSCLPLWNSSFSDFTYRWFSRRHCRTTLKMKLVLF